MPINRDTNPMIATSVCTTLSIFFSTPVFVNEIRWLEINATTSSPLVLKDIDGNMLFKSSTSTDMQVLEDGRLFPNGLVLGSASTVVSETTMSVNLNIGKLFVWVR